MSGIALWLIAIIYIEAVTEMLLNGEIFEGLREILFEYGGWFFQTLFTCGYCLSVWVAMTVAWALPVPVLSGFFGFLVATFAAHRLSNMFHELIARWLGRMPWTLQVNHIQHVEIPGE